MKNIMEDLRVAVDEDERNGEDLTIFEERLVGKTFGDLSFSDMERVSQLAHVDKDNLGEDGRCIADITEFVAIAAIQKDDMLCFEASEKFYDIRG